MQTMRDLAKEDDLCYNGSQREHLGRKDDGYSLGDEDLRL